MESNGINISGSGIGSTVSIGNGTNTFSVLSNYSEKRLIKVEVKETTIEIAYRESPNFTYCLGYGNNTPPDRVWKEVYGLKDGKMTLLEVIKGTHHQAYNVSESFEFDDEKTSKTPANSSDL